MYWDHVHPLLHRIHILKKCLIFKKTFFKPFSFYFLNNAKIFTQNFGKRVLLALAVPKVPSVSESCIAFTLGSSGYFQDLVKFTYLLFMALSVSVADPVFYPCFVVVPLA